nr:ABC transporter permease [Bacilli bacterium]
KNINSTITTDITPALNDYNESLNNVLNGFKDNMNVESYLNSSNVKNIIKNLDNKYYIPGDTYKTIYKGILDGVLTAYNLAIEQIPDNMKDAMKDQVYQTIVTGVLDSAEIKASASTMAKTMSETKMRVVILQNVSNMTSNLTNSLSKGFDISPDKITSAFKLNFSEDELMRVVSAMSTQESTIESNLVKLGYQDKDEPSVIAIYFNSFDGKENFIKFVDKYNEGVDDETKINYSDVTGALMSSVKTTVNAVSYVLIAFVSISLVVSSIMIGIITYISVYERTKEIGILRAIGASKRNISSIFNAETFIIGLLSGLFGVAFTYAVIPVINHILISATNNVNVKAILLPSNALILIVLSIILTLIGGIIPAKTASKKDPVIALRTE